MEPTPELVRAIHRERLERALRMTPEERLLAGSELFEEACAVTLAGIRWQHPGVSEDEALEILRQRLERVQRREDRA
jgi:hypothetical protein